MLIEHPVVESFPDVGSVTFVVPVDVRVTEFDPDVSNVDCPVNIIPLDDTVNAPELTVGDVIEGDVKVLFVSVCVPDSRTMVSVRPETFELSGKYIDAFDADAALGDLSI